MGEVYKALHLPLNRHVAIKVLPPRKQNEKERVLRFLREIQTQGEVDRHPHIVYATDAGEADGVHYLVMELVGGRDLSQLLEETGGPLAVNDACAIIRHVALALSYLHGCELVHRDVKPSNVILSGDGTAKLLDLGLASLIRSDRGRLTDPTRIVGSLQYSSPEQVTDIGQIGPATDVYGLGATFYELLTGEPPLLLDDDDAFVRTIVGEAPIPVSDRRSDIPAEVDQLLCSMLAKAPENRPSASAVVNTLERHVEGCDSCSPRRRSPPLCAPTSPAARRRGLLNRQQLRIPTQSGVRLAWESSPAFWCFPCCSWSLGALCGRRHAGVRRDCRCRRTRPPVRPHGNPGRSFFPGSSRLPHDCRAFTAGRSTRSCREAKPTILPGIPTGTLIALPCSSGDVRVYELRDSQLRLRMLLPHAEPVVSVAWSRDGGSLPRWEHPRPSVCGRWPTGRHGCARPTKRTHEERPVWPGSRRTICWLRAAQTAC